VFWTALWTWLNRIGAVVGILGVAFGVYAYVNCQPVRRLTFYADPASALIVKSGQTSNLMVSYDGKPISTDVIAAQITLWNAGKLPIKPEHIRDPIVIKTDPPRPILEPTIRTSTPEREKIINAQIDKTDAPLGRIKLTWDLLEQDDGFQIQLIFAGPSDTRLVPSGVIEGQKHIAVLSVEQTDRLARLMLIAMVSVGLGLVLVSLIALFFPWGRSKDIPPPVWYNLVSRAGLTAVVILGTCAVLRTFLLGVERPRLMPQSLMTPGLRQELQKQDRLSRP
jgi:hypothetical protein